MILGADKDSFIWWDWVWDHTDEIKAATIEHLQLTAIALGVGLVLSIALATIAIRWQKAYAPIAGFAGVLYAIPSLALFAILFPITGLTVLTAEIALVGYTLLILIRNIVAGVRACPTRSRRRPTAWATGRCTGSSPSTSGWPPRPSWPASASPR